MADKAKDLMRKWLIEDGIPEERADAYFEAMDLIKAVLDGKAKFPGGPGCRFPYCVCNSPWELCEKDSKKQGQTSI